MDEGFCVVVLLVSRGYPGATVFSCDFAQRHETQVSSCGLDGQLLRAGTRLNIDRSRDDGHAQPVCELDDELFVLVAGAASQAVIDVGTDKLRSDDPLVSQPLQDVQQADGIGAPRDCHHNSRSSGEDLVQPEKIGHGLVHAVGHVTQSPNENGPDTRSDPLNVETSRQSYLLSEVVNSWIRR